MLNKVMLIGRLGRDPELQYGKTGAPFVRAAIGTNESYIDSATGQRVDVAQWTNITAFGKTAENMCKYTQKGSRVYVEGKIKTDSWDDPRSGQKKVYKTYVLAERVQFLDSKPKEGDAQGYQQFTQSQPMQQRQPTMSYPQQQRQPQAQPSQGDRLEEVPF